MTAPTPAEVAALVKRLREFPLFFRLDGESRWYTDEHSKEPLCIEAAAALEALVALAGRIHPR